MSHDGIITVSDSTITAISGTSTSVVSDRSASQSSIEQQTSQLAAGDLRLIYSYIGDLVGYGRNVTKEIQMK